MQQIIAQSQMDSMIDLENQELTDYDMDTIVKEVIKKGQCNKLWLPGNKITFVGASILAAGLQNNSTLERLFLYSNFLTDKGVKSLSTSLAMNNNVLKILNLQETEITDCGAEYLADMLKQNTMLTVLWLSKNKISDSGVHRLANSLAHYNHTLECLDLSKNRITDSSVDALQDMIRHNQSLDELSLYDCNLSRVGKETLKKTARTKKEFKIFVNNWDN